MGTAGQTIPARELCAVVMRAGLLIALSTRCGALQAEERYRIDPAHTISMFEYEHWGISLQHGRFDGNTGTIAIDPVAKTGTIDIEISANSVSTGNNVFDAVLRSAQFFDASTYPIITFRSTELRFEGDRLAQVDGLLTIRAVTRAVTLNMSRFDCRFMFMYARRACGANGSAQLSRTDFGLGRYVPFVSDRVTLFISVEAIREAPADQ